MANAFLKDGHMNSRLARISLAAALAVLPGCGSSKTDQKIALQIEPNQPALQPDLPGSRDSLATRMNSGSIEPSPIQDTAPRTQADSAGLLARKTESYAKSIQDAMAKRASLQTSPSADASKLAEAKQPDAKASPLAPALSQHTGAARPGLAAQPATPPEGQESLVQWLDPNQFRIGGSESADAAGSQTAALAKAQTSSNARPLVNGARVNGGQVNLAPVNGTSGNGTPGNVTPGNGTPGNSMQGNSGAGNITSGNGASGIGAPINIAAVNNASMTGALAVGTPIQASIAKANQGAEIDSGPIESPRAALISEMTADKASAIISPPADPFESRIARRVKEYPRDVSANLDYQLMLFLRDEPVPQLSSITALPTEDRELISAVMDGMSNFRSTLRSDNNMLLSKKIRPMIELSDRLRQQAELSIPTLVLCSKVDGFGRYEPIDPPRLVAQTTSQAIVYCEIENFTSQLNAAKQWQTDVVQEAILYTEDGVQVWADKSQPIQDLSRKRRHDFFLRTLVKFPPTLTLGRYMLKVTIIDRQANRVAEASLPIQTVAR